MELVLRVGQSGGSAAGTGLLHFCGLCLL